MFFKYSSLVLNLLADNATDDTIISTLQKLTSAATDTNNRYENQKEIVVEILNAVSKLCQAHDDKMHLTKPVLVCVITTLNRLTDCCFEFAFMIAQVCKIHLGALHIILIL